MIYTFDNGIEKIFDNRESLSSLQEWAIDRTFYWKDILSQKFNCPYKKQIDISFSNRMGKTAGLAYPTLSKIKYSSIYLSQIPKFIFDKTIAHEVAHLYSDFFFQKSTKHSKLWKRVMGATGYRPDSCHKYQNVIKEMNKLRLIYPNLQELKI